jgi:predicted MPP superfamily phosphohydrolase
MGFVAVLHIYLYWTLRQGLGRRLAWLYLGAAAVFNLFPMARYYEMTGDGRFVEVFFALTITEYVITGMITVVIVSMEILKMLLFLWDKIAKTHAENFITSRRTVTFSLSVVSCVVLWALCEAWALREVHVVIPTGKLPQNVERVRIVQISDIHLGGLYHIAHLRRAMEMVRAAKPDIFVVTGDLVDGNMVSRNAEAELVSNHGAKYGAFAITGNHEHYNGLEQSIEFMERSGLTVLYDQTVEADGIVIVGLDDLTTLWPMDLKIPEGRFVLLLRHRPQVLKTSQGKFDLQISGHTHGGQLWPIGPLSQKRQGYVQGLSKQNGSYVYVSNGTGFWGPPMRFLTPPEVTVIDLVSE